VAAAGLESSLVSLTYILAAGILGRSVLAVRAFFGPEDHAQRNGVSTMVGAQGRNPGRGNVLDGGSLLLVFDSDFASSELITFRFFLFAAVEPSAASDLGFFFDAPGLGEGLVGAVAEDRFPSDESTVAAARVLRPDRVDDGKTSAGCGKDDAFTCGQSDECSPPGAV